MKYADWRYLATICTVSGVILLIGGVIAYSYSQTSYFRGIPIGTTYPYRGYALPFIVFGIILLVIGVASFARAGEERKLEVERPKPVSVSLRKCPKCGMKFSLEYEYCPTCGAKLESA